LESFSISSGAQYRAEGFVVVAATSEESASYLTYAHKISDRTKNNSLIFVCLNQKGFRVYLIESSELFAFADLGETVVDSTAGLS
jgi:hypothetical protein